jgi:hypothetical protein
MLTIWNGSHEKNICRKLARPERLKRHTHKFRTWISS